MPNVPKSSLLTLQEASNLLNCHPNTLRQWDKLGILHAVRVGSRGDRRYRKEDILNIMASPRSQPENQPPVIRQTDEILDRISNAFVAFDTKWRFTYVNHKAQELLDLIGKDLIGKSLLDLYPQTKSTAIFKAMEFARHTGNVVHKSFSLSTDDVWYEAAIYPSSTGMTITIEDITQQHKEEKNTAFLTKVYNTLSSTLDYDKTLTNISRIIVPEIADWFSVEIIDKLQGLRIVEISHKDPKKVKWAYKLREKNAPDMHASYGVPSVIKTGKSELYADISDETLITIAKGKRQLALLRKIGFTSAMVVPLLVRGKIVGAVTFVSAESGKHFDENDLKLAKGIGRLAGVAIDNARLYSNLQHELIERGKIENSLRASEQRLEKYLENSTDAVLVLDKKGKIVYRSSIAEKVSGYSNTEVMQTDIFLAICHEDRKRVKATFKDLVAHPGKTITIDYRVMHKNGCTIWAEATATSLLADPNIQGIVVNFRDITQRRETAERLKEQAEFIERAHDAILMLNESNNILFWNKEAEKLYGWKAEEVMGKFSSGVLQTVFPVPFTELMQQVKNNKVWEGELIHTTKNGQKIVVESRWALIKGADNQTRILEINRDITERKELENRKDEFISIASHELKTPLTSLKVFAQYLQKYSEISGDRTLQQYLQKIVDQSDSLTELVADLLDISKIQSGHLPFQDQVFDLQECIEDRVAVANALTTHNVIMTGKLPLVYGDKERLCQVFDNLLSNAIKYSPSSNKVDVLLSANATTVRICVRDYGIGIDKKYQQKIFERFFRAGGAYEKTFPGLGIGLYISSQIMKRHGGTIEVKSTRKRGSQFCMVLPLKK